LSTIAVKWLEERGRLFACQDSSGNQVMAGSWPDGDSRRQEWQAAKPVDLLLMSLAACAAHDVVSILERQRQILTGLHIDVEGRQQPDPPHAFTDIHLHFRLRGASLNPVKVERALSLSVDKYCSVAATIRAVATITHGYEIES
jgi:putative redox protein